MPHRQFNADAITDLVRYESRALLLRRGTEARVTATHEAVAHSQALMVKIGAVIGEPRQAGYCHVLIVGSAADGPCRRRVHGYLKRGGR